MSLSIISINNANPNDTSNILIIKSADNNIFCISKEAACKSIVINNMLETLDETNEPIPLTQECCTNENLHKVLIFLDYIHYNQNETDALQVWVDSKGYTGGQPEWFKEYIDVSQNILFNILLIADFLDIKILIDFACLTIANQIKRMSPDEIQQVFNPI